MNFISLVKHINGKNNNKINSTANHGHNDNDIIVFIVAITMQTIIIETTAIETIPITNKQLVNNKDTKSKRYQIKGTKNSKIDKQSS